VSAGQIDTFHSADTATAHFGREAFAHRGPDRAGVCVGGGAWLGRARRRRSARGEGHGDNTWVSNNRVNRGCGRSQCRRAAALWILPLSATTERQSKGRAGSAWSRRFNKSRNGPVLCRNHRPCCSWPGCRCKAPARYRGLFWPAVMTSPGSARGSHGAPTLGRQWRSSSSANHRAFLRPSRSGNTTNPGPFRHARRVAVWGHQLGQQISGYPSGPALTVTAPAGTTPARAAPALGGGCPLQQGEKAPAEEPGWGSAARAHRWLPLSLCSDFRFAHHGPHGTPSNGRTRERWPSHAGSNAGLTKARCEVPAHGRAGPLAPLLLNELVGGGGAISMTRRVGTAASPRRSAGWAPFRFRGWDSRCFYNLTGVSHWVAVWFSQSYAMFSRTTITLVEFPVGQAKPYVKALWLSAKNLSR